MFRQLMFSCACLAVLSAEAQKDKPWWLDPEVNESTFFDRFNNIVHFLSI